MMTVKVNSISVGIFDLLGQFVGDMSAPDFFDYAAHYGIFNESDGKTKNYADSQTESAVFYAAYNSEKSEKSKGAKKYLFNGNCYV